MVSKASTQPDKKPAFPNPTFNILEVFILAHFNFLVYLLWKYYLSAVRDQVQVNEKICRLSHLPEQRTCTYARQGNPALAGQLVWLQPTFNQTQPSQMYDMWFLGSSWNVPPLWVHWKRCVALIPTHIVMKAMWLWRSCCFLFMTARGKEFNGTSEYYACISNGSMSEK